MTSNAAFQNLHGPPGSNADLSKQLVCFEACKKLHEMGALNDHLLPMVENPPNYDSMSKGSSSRADRYLCQSAFGYYQCIFSFHGQQRGRNCMALPLFVLCLEHGEKRKITEFFRLALCISRVVQLRSVNARVSSEKDLEEIYENVEKKAEFHVHIPPELLVVIDKPISVVPNDAPNGVPNVS